MYSIYLCVLIPKVTSNKTAMVATMKQPLQWKVDSILEGLKDSNWKPKGCCFSLSSCCCTAFDISSLRFLRASWFVNPFGTSDGELSYIKLK